MRDLFSYRSSADGTFDPNQPVPDADAALMSLLDAVALDGDAERETLPVADGAMEEQTDHPPNPFPRHVQESTMLRQFPPVTVDTMPEVVDRLHEFANSNHRMTTSITIDMNGTLFRFSIKPLGTVSEDVESNNAEPVAKLEIGRWIHDKKYEQVGYASIPPKPSKGHFATGIEEIFNGFVDAKREERGIQFRKKPKPTRDPYLIK